MHLFNSFQSFNRFAPFKPLKRERHSPLHTFVTDYFEKRDYGAEVLC
jgi:hypothetical protein